MSGYHTHELCLTPFDEPASAVLARARAFLQQGYSLVEDSDWGGLLEVEGHGPGEYFVAESLVPSDEELDEAVATGFGVQILQKVKFLRAHYTTMLMIIPGDRVGFIWKIESSTFRELHTWEGPGRWNKKMKTAFVGYVYGLARACAAEGFVMKRDGDELCVYNAEQIGHSMQYHEPDTPLDAPALAGVETKYLSLEQLRQVAAEGRRSKYYYTVFDRYTVADYMFPSDKPW